MNGGGENRQGSNLEIESLPPKMAKTDQVFTKLFSPSCMQLEYISAFLTVM